jgi:hypothetical protein
MVKGSHISDAHRQAVKEAQERRWGSADRTEQDVAMLDALGQTQTWEFAGHMGYSEATAKNRLRRLFERGLADRHKERGSVAWTYTSKTLPKSSHNQETK